MSYVADINYLNYGSDVKGLYAGNSAGMESYMRNHPNSTWYGIVWCTSSWDVDEDFSVPCKYERTDKDMYVYAVYFNYTLAPFFFANSPNLPVPVHPNLLQIKNSIDNAIMLYLNMKEGKAVKERP